MNSSALGKFLLVTLLLCGYNMVYAQKNKQNTFSKSADGSGMVYKKQVYRIVDLGKKDEGGSDRLRDVNEDKTLIEMISNEVKDGTLAAYSNSELRVLNKLNDKEIKKLFGPKPDTALVQDAATGRWESNITKKDFSYDAVHKYKILEEWSCHPVTGATDIQVLAICPLQDLVARDGSVRALIPLFWVRFANLSAILATYQQYQPNNTIMSRIWDDYFTTDKPSAQK